MITKNENFVEAMAALDSMGADPVMADPWDVDPDTDLWALWFGHELEHVVGESVSGEIGVALNNGDKVDQFKTMAEALAYVSNNVYMEA